jgi:hypothetical protein
MSAGDKFCAACGTPKTAPTNSGARQHTKTLPLVAAGVVILLVIAAFIGSNNDSKTSAPDSSAPNAPTKQLHNNPDPEDSNFGRGWPIDVEELYSSVEATPYGFTSPYAGKGVYVVGTFGGKVPGRNNWIFVRGFGGHSMVAIPAKEWLDLATIDELKLALGEHVAETCGLIRIEKDGVSGGMVIYAEKCFLSLSEQQLREKGILGSDGESVGSPVPGTAAGVQQFDQIRATKYPNGYRADEFCDELKIFGEKRFCYPFNWKPCLKELEQETAGNYAGAISADSGVQTPGNLVLSWNGEGRVVFGGCRPHECPTAKAYFIVTPSTKELERVAKPCTRGWISGSYFPVGMDRERPLRQREGRWRDTVGC